MNTVIGREIQDTIENATRLEWLVTNGIGGFASSTIPNINTRRYHGILVASMRPPVERLVLVSRLEEIVTVNGRSFHLDTSIHKDEIQNPAGHLMLERYEQEPLPTWYYQIKDVLLIKTLAMVHGQNRTVVTYKVFKNDNDVSLSVRPHYLFRDFHGNMFENQGFNIAPEILDKVVTITPFANAPTLYMYQDQGEFITDAKWHKDIFLQVEKDRGLEELEDDFSSGYFKFKNMSSSASIMFSDSQVPSFNPIDIRKKEESRINNIALSFNSEDILLQKLLKAADQFIVYRASTDSKSIIAGYPWFSDWGRDSLIALPGLTLVPGRYDDARSILKTFANSINHGLIPNCFADEGVNASYNSVDASLWFFFAAYKYVEYTDDYEFVKEHLYEGMMQIIEAFQKGTIYDICMDTEDSLVRAGNKDVQLTWMDARSGNVVVTPRNGKAVEINALWYNALRIYAIFQEKFEGNSREITALAKAVKVSFRETFYDEDRSCLFDYIKDNGEADTAVRPNQILAVYLPFSVLTTAQEKEVVKQVFEKLYTSHGLRSLSPDNIAYESFYNGNREQRDLAYHQGTAWAYLIGPFISSYLKVNNFSMESLLRASYMIEPFRTHLDADGCIGNISEVFDGDQPHSSKGCFAQAWSVAELLRCYVEDIKGQKPTFII